MITKFRLWLASKLWTIKTTPVVRVLYSEDLTYYASRALLDANGKVVGQVCW